MNKKEIAMSFLKMAGMEDVRKAYEKFVAQDFIHHNQYFKGDRTSLMHAMEDAQKTDPNRSLDVKHIYEDGETVITHSHVVKDKMEIAVVHIFRIPDDKIVELWDLGQVMEEDSPNEHGMF